MCRLRCNAAGTASIDQLLSYIYYQITRKAGDNVVLAGDGCRDIFAGPAFFLSACLSPAESRAGRRRRSHAPALSASSIRAARVGLFFFWRPSPRPPVSDRIAKKPAGQAITAAMPLNDKKIRADREPETNDEF